MTTHKYLISNLAFSFDGFVPKKMSYKWPPLFNWYLLRQRKLINIFKQGLGLGIMIKYFTTFDGVLTYDPLNYNVEISDKGNKGIVLGYHFGFALRLPFEQRIIDPRILFSNDLNENDFSAFNLKISW